MKYILVLITMVGLSGFVNFDSETSENNNHVINSSNTIHAGGELIDPEPLKEPTISI